MKNQSLIDPSRKTVGAIYRDAQMNGEKQVVVGDLSYELRKSLADDINDTIFVGRQEFEERPFYITVYEKWDYQMTKAFVRRLIKTVYRPYPEADTSVYKVIPQAEEVYFCWDLPHRNQMLNMLNSPEIFDVKDLQKIRQWENDQLEHFGFTKDSEGKWIVNPFFQGDIILNKGNEKEVKVTIL